MKRLYFNGSSTIRDIGTHYTKNVGLTQRVISMLRKDIDVAIMYESEDTINLLDWYIQNEYITQNQVILIPYTRPDDQHYSSNIILEITDILRSNPHDTEFVIGEVTSEIFYFLQSWTKKYGGNIMKDTNCPLKNSLYPNPKLEPPPNYIENSLIPRLRGYWCTDKESLLEAYSNLKALNIQEFVIKPISTSSGAGIVFFKDIEEIQYYSFQYGDIVLEEKANLRPIFPVYHFEGNELCGGLCSQIIDGSEFIGVTNIYPIDQEIITVAEKTKGELVKSIQLESFWGVDLLVVGSTVYVNDINAGRLNGSHPPKYFIKNHYHCNNDNGNDSDVKYIMRAFTTKSTLSQLFDQDPIELLKSIESKVFEYIDIALFNCVMIPILHTRDIDHSNCRMLWIFTPK